MPYGGDVAVSLRELREQVFRDKNYYWWDDFEEDAPRPATIEGIWDVEEMQHSGTHSILDVDRVVDTTAAPSWDNWQEDLRTVRPLGGDLVQHYFGTGQPSRAQFEELAGTRDAVVSRRFWDEVKMRGTGLYVLLYAEGAPAEIGFWGFSGD
jgi:hypothetical protein